MRRTDMFKVSSLALATALVTGCASLNPFAMKSPEAPQVEVAAAPLPVTEAPLNEALRKIIPDDYTVALDGSIKPELYLVAAQGQSGDWRAQLAAITLAQGLRYREDGKTVFVEPVGMASAAAPEKLVALPKKNDTRTDDLVSAVPFAVVDAPPPVAAKPLSDKPVKLVELKSDVPEAKPQASVSALSDAKTQASGPTVEAVISALPQPEPVAAKPATKPLSEVLAKIYPKAKVIAASNVDLSQQVVWQPEQGQKEALAAIAATSDLTFEADGSLVFVRRGLSSRDLAPVVAAAIAAAAPEQPVAQVVAEPAAAPAPAEPAPVAVAAAVVEVPQAQETAAVQLTPVVEEMIPAEAPAKPAEPKAAVAMAGSVDDLMPAATAIVNAKEAAPSPSPVKADPDKALKPVAFYKPAPVVEPKPVDAVAAPTVAPQNIMPAAAPATVSPPVADVVAPAVPVPAPAVVALPDPAAMAVAAAAPVAPDMTAPLGSNFAAEAKLPIPTAPSVWSARRGTTLRAVLQEWCDAEGVQLNWDTEFDYPLEASIDVKGSFENAVRTLLTGFSMAAPQPIGRLHRQANLGNGVLVVQTRGNRYEN